ncbi:MAG: pilus assembly protein PilP [Nitrospirota bacterium]
MKKIILCLITFLLLFFIGCKKEPVPAKAPVAKKVEPAGVNVATKEAEAVKDVASEEYLYDPKGKRDPFSSLLTTMQKPLKKKGLSPIESISVDEVVLLAIALDEEKHKYYALILLPDNKAFTITEGMNLGLQGGKVLKITENTMLVREYIKDYKGNIIPKDIVLKLHKGEEE